MSGPGVTLRVALGHEDAQAAGTSVVEVAELLRELTHDLLPGARTELSVSLDGDDLGGSGFGAEPPTAGLVVDLDTRRVFVDGAELELTYREFELLAYFAGRPGRALRRQEIFTQVWGLDHLGGARTIDVHVRRLRVKLGAHGTRIRTLRGVGYRFEAA